MNLSTHIFKFQGNSNLLDSQDTIMQVCESIAKLANCQVIKNQVHKFSPQGITATYLLAESHIAIHTWPENNFGYLVLTSCSELPSSFEQDAVQEFITYFDSNEDGILVTHV